MKIILHGEEMQRKSVFLSKYVCYTKLIWGSTKVHVLRTIYLPYENDKSNIESFVIALSQMIFQTLNSYMFQVAGPASSVGCTSAW